MDKMWREIRIFVTSAFGILVLLVALLVGVALISTRGDDSSSETTPVRETTTPRSSSGPTAAWYAAFTDWFKTIVEAHTQAGGAAAEVGIALKPGGGHLDAEFFELTKPIEPLNDCLYYAGGVARGNPTRRPWQIRVRALVRRACLHFTRGFQHIVDARLSGDASYLDQANAEFNTGSLRRTALARSSRHTCLESS